MMLQSSLDWLWKLVVWGGLEFKMYIFKVVWFGFGPVAQTITRVTYRPSLGPRNSHGILAPPPRPAAEAKAPGRRGRPAPRHRQSRREAPPGGAARRDPPPAGLPQAPRLRLDPVADVHPGPPVPWPGVRPKKLLKKPKKLLKKNKYTTSR